MFTQIIETVSSAQWSIQGLLIGIGLLVVLYITGTILYEHFLSPLSDVPGPFWASVSRFWLVSEVLRARLHRATPELHKKYGPIVRIAPDEVSIADPEAIKIIYAVNSGFIKTDFYDPFGPLVKTPMGELFSLRDERLHAERRRIVSGVYSMTNVLKSEPYINTCTLEFMKVMQDYADQRTAIDLGEYLQRFAFDVIGELFYGSMFGFLTERRDVGNYIESLDALMPVFTLFGSMTSLWKMQPILGLLPGVLSPFKNMMKLNQVARQCVEARQHKISERTDILSNLFAIQADRPDFTTDEIFNDSFDAIGAGSDTTAVAMRSVLYHVMKNPKVYFKLQEEIDNADRKGELSDPVSFAEAMRLPYLVSVCKEGMRVFPSVGMTLTRFVPPGGRMIANKFFPQGVRVGVNAFVVHQDKDIFGDDAEMFNPDRWLQGQAKNMDRYMFQASTLIMFGSGSRTCIGKNISLCEIHKIVPQILRRFKLSLEHPEKEWEERGVWFTKQSGINVFIEARK